MKFKYKTKGSITQGFGENIANAYKPLRGHPGVDWDTGYGSLIRSDNDGYVYKILDGTQDSSGYTAVCLLVPYGDDFMEIQYGHISEALVKEGDYVKEGQFIAREGNSGLVFSNGVQITLAMQKEGDKRGAHVHEQWRPVRRVKTLTTRHYLNKGGRRYKDAEGYLYEIIENDNGYNGCINSRLFDYVDTRMDVLNVIKNAALNLLEKIKAIQ